MKPKFTVSGTLAINDGAGIETIETPMLLVTKFAGMKISRDYDGLEETTEGALGKALKKDSFTGELGEHVVTKLGKGYAQERLLIIGLGRAQQFACAGVRELVKTAVNAAVRRRVSKISIPFVPNRTTSGNLTLSSTAHILRSVAIEVLEAKKSDGVLEIELVCSSQAKRHIEAGLRKQVRKNKKTCDPCDNV